MFFKSTYIELGCVAKITSLIFLQQTLLYFPILNKVKIVLPKFFELSSDRLGILSEGPNFEESKNNKENKSYLRAGVGNTRSLVS